MPIAKGIKLSNGEIATFPEGADGSKILKVSTLVTSYTNGCANGFTPTYRIALSTVLREAGVDEVRINDIIWLSYYHYPIGYVDNDYVYLGQYVNIRGAEGHTPLKGTDYFTAEDKSEIVESVLASLTNANGIKF